MYSLAHFRPRESRTVYYVSWHWGLFLQELVEIELIGYRECQEITYWVQKHFFHWYCILIGRWHIRDMLDVIHQTTFYRMEISVFCLKYTGLYCTPGTFMKHANYPSTHLLWQSKKEWFSPPIKGKLTKHKFRAKKSKKTTFLHILNVESFGIYG